MKQDLYEFNHSSDVPAKSFVNRDDYQHIVDTLCSVPHYFRRPLLDQYHDYYGAYQQDSTLKFSQCRRTANLFFLDIQKYAQGKNFLNHSDKSLRAKAKRYAHYSARLLRQKPLNLTAALKWLAVHDIKAPNAAHDEGLKARLIDEQWWLRQLVTLHDRQYEQIAIRLGLVRGDKQAYVSNASLKKIQARRQRSLKMLSEMVAVSDAGDEVEMSDILKASAANPSIRRAELMNRLHGFEHYADAHQHSAEFYTLTAPSHYHANSNKYNHWSPRQVQQAYFSPLWARIRAKLKYESLNVYGFRIAEAHGDACPHWHILLFMPAASRLKVRAILKDYALRESPDEAGAAANRFDYETINKDKGSAIGYIAKYISKNVDGFGMEDQYETETALPIDAAAQRVRAWASVWGIRQFQQIGGSSITVWRELRRLRDQKQSDVTLEAARKAADSGNWHAYLEAQGGTDILRKHHAIKPYRLDRCDLDTGELENNQYGELVSYIKGVMTTGVVVETRLKRWTIQRKIMEEEAIDLPWSTVNNCRIPKEAEYNNG